MSEALFDVDLARAEAVLLRYAGAGPRYTSYPTAPVWSESYGPVSFAEDLAALDPSQPLSFYVHVPFCRALCHFCACNRVITRDAALPERFLDGMERELAAVRESVPAPGPVIQHHWGGGTPTHLTPQQVGRLFHAAAEAFPLAPGAEVSIEVDPRVTTPEHVAALRECGFNRLSLGVQDFEPRVQQAIHRVQSIEETAALVARARESGFLSVSFDLIYGLPFQSLESMTRTIESVLAIGPDRIALYAYAHVTWVAKQQRGFERHDLPEPGLRLRLQLAAMQLLLRAGYVHVGMDHFARPEDELTRALRDRTLRRNFMGYTTHAGLDLLGFGPSAISELEGAYAQSVREPEAWGRVVEGGELATLRGHRLTEDDMQRRWVIGEIMCHGGVRAADWEVRFGGDFAQRFGREISSLEGASRDGLVVLEGDGSLHVSPLGRLVVRNVAMAFDAYLSDQQRAPRPLFSQTV